jgi:hypothetical protein
MARLRTERQGKSLRVGGLAVSYSLWPARKTTRWKLQRRLYVRDPWAILFEAVYRSKLPKVRINETLSYLEQAEDYFNAGNQGWRLNVKPVLLYYSMLNLAKSILVVRNSSLDMAQARHGLVAVPQGRAILGDLISLRTSQRYVNVFSELIQSLEGRKPTFGDLQVRHLLSQILLGHRLWTYASGKNERFVALADIDCWFDQVQQHVWMRLWAAIYVLFFYLSDLTRYRPQHFDRFLESKYGPQIESILGECPRQFLFLMASELLEREVAPAGLA